MVQSEIIDYLKQEQAFQPNKWFTTKEIKDALKDKVNQNGIHKALVKLWMFSIVKFKGKHILDKSKTWRLK